MHYLAVDDPHLPRVLLHEFDCADGVGFRRRQYLLKTSLQHVGSSEGIGCTDDCEEVVVLAELFERVLQPFDVRRGRGCELGRTQERDVCAVPLRDLGNLAAVGGADDSVEDAGLTRGRNRVGEQRVSRERADVLVLDALGAGARGDQCDCARHASSASASRRSNVGARTSSRFAARTTAPRIASSSVGRPAAASRAVEVVTLAGIVSRISHWAPSSRMTPSAAATAHASATAARRGARHVLSVRSWPRAFCVIAVAAARGASRTVFSQRTACSLSPTRTSSPASLSRWAAPSSGKIVIKGAEVVCTTSVGLSRYASSFPMLPASTRPSRRLRMVSTCSRPLS